MVKELAITTTYQEYTFIVKHCHFTSAFGARSLSSKSYVEKDFASIPNI